MIVDEFARNCKFGMQMKINLSSHINNVIIETISCARNFVGYFNHKIHVLKSSAYFAVGNLGILGVLCSFPTMSNTRLDQLTNFLSYEFIQWEKVNKV